MNERFLRPASAGKAGGGNAAGTGVSFQCGCFVRFSMLIDVRSKIVVEAGFVSNGCGYMVAAADATVVEIDGREITTLGPGNAGEIRRAVGSVLGSFPGARDHCVDAVLDALQAALADHRSHLIEEFRGEKALICTCFGVTEETVERFIADKAPETVDEVAKACRAGSGCGSCRMLIQEMLDELPVQPQ